MSEVAEEEEDDSRCMTCGDPNDRGPGTTNCSTCWDNECMRCGEVVDPEDLLYSVDESCYVCKECVEPDEVAIPADDWPCEDYVEAWKDELDAARPHYGGP